MTKIRCEYCRQRNDAEGDCCSFCGAELPDVMDSETGRMVQELSTPTVYGYYYGKPVTDISEYRRILDNEGLYIPLFNR